MLVATHDLPLAAELCERAVILAQGSVVADGPCFEILGDSELLAEHDLELPVGLDLTRVRRRARPGDSHPTAVAMSRFYVMPDVAPAHRLHPNRRTSAPVADVVDSKLQIRASRQHLNEFVGDVRPRGRLCRKELQRQPRGMHCRGSLTTDVRHDPWQQRGAAGPRTRR